MADKFPLERGMEVDELPRSIEKGGLGTNYNRPNDGVSAAAATHVLSDALKAGLEKMVRPGESYTIYNGHDEFGRVPEKYAIVVNRAMQWSGVSDDDLFCTIERFERRLVRRWRKSKSSKRERGVVKDETDGETSGE